MRMTLRRAAWCLWFLTWIPVYLVRASAMLVRTAWSGLGIFVFLYPGDPVKERIMSPLEAVRRALRPNSHLFISWPTKKGDEALRDEHQKREHAEKFMGQMVADLLNQKAPTPEPPVTVQ